MLLVKQKVVDMLVMLLMNIRRCVPIYNWFPNCKLQHIPGIMPAFRSRTNPESRVNVNEKTRTFFKHSSKSFKLHPRGVWIKTTQGLSLGAILQEVGTQSFDKIARFLLSYSSAVAVETTGEGDNVRELRDPASLVVTLVTSGEENIYYEYNMICHIWIMRLQWRSNGFGRPWYVSIPHLLIGKRCFHLFKWKQIM